MKKKNRLIIILVLCCVLLIAPAAGAASTLDGITVARGMMLHARQALERYDASGQPLLQYYELWADASRAMQREVNQDGTVLSWSYSGPGEHLSWTPDTLKAVKPEESTVFFPNYAALKAGFATKTEVPGQAYAGRPCTAVLLEDKENEEDWLKLYLDDETGFVLFCEASLFRLRTALLETLPADEAHLTPPDGLIF